MRDPANESGAGKQTFDIPAGVAVAAVQLESITKRRVAACGVLEGKDQQAARAERSGGGPDNIPQGSEIDERVCGNDKVERRPAVTEVLRQFALHELVVDTLFLRATEHPGGQVDT